MDSCHIRVDTTNLFNKCVGLVFNIWNSFDLFDLFN